MKRTSRRLFSSFHHCLSVSLDGPQLDSSWGPHPSSHLRRWTKLTFTLIFHTLKNIWTKRKPIDVIFCGRRRQITASHFISSEKTFHQHLERNQPHQRDTNEQKRAKTSQRRSQSVFLCVRPHMSAWAERPMKGPSAGGGRERKTAAERWGRLSRVCSWTVRRRLIRWWGRELCFWCVFVTLKDRKCCRNRISDKQ